MEPSQRDRVEALPGSAATLGRWWEQARRAVDAAAGRPPQNPVREDQGCLACPEPGRHGAGCISLK